MSYLNVPDANCVRLPRAVSVVGNTRFEVSESNVSVYVVSTNVPGKGRDGVYNVQLRVFDGVGGVLYAVVNVAFIE